MWHGVLEPPPPTHMDAPVSGAPALSMRSVQQVATPTPIRGRCRTDGFEVASSLVRWAHALRRAGSERHLAGVSASRWQVCAARRVREGPVACEFGDRRTDDVDTGAAIKRRCRQIRIAAVHRDLR